MNDVLRIWASLWGILRPAITVTVIRVREGLCPIAETGRCQTIELIVPKGITLPYDVIAETYDPRPLEVSRFHKLAKDKPGLASRNKPSPLDDPTNRNVCLGQTITELIAYGPGGPFCTFDMREEG